MTPRDKGAGSLYQRKSDGMWCASVRLPPGADGSRRRITKVRKRKGDAVTALRELRAQVDKMGDVRTGLPTVEVHVRDWIAQRAAIGALRPRTVASHTGCLDRYIAPSIGRVRLDRLTPAHVRQMRAYIEGSGRSATTALQAHNVLSGALKSAVRDGMIARNAAADTDRPKVDHFEAQVLDLGQALAVLRWAESEGWMEAARWGVALLAGLRQGEALGLTRQHVDLGRGIVRIAWQLQQLDHEPPKSMRARHLGGRMWLTPPKSEKGIREVPLVDGLRLVLKRRLDEMPPDPWAFVFTAPQGGPRDASKDARAWKRALDNAGSPRVRLHDARHTTGTLLRAADVEPRLIQAILGHNTAAMTEHYSHIAPDEAALAMGKFQALIESGGQ